MPERAARRNTRVTAVSAVAVVTCVTLFLIAGCQSAKRDKRTRAELRAAVARLDATTRVNAAAILKSCRLTNAARAQSNAQIRRPLKEMLAYVVAITDANLQRQADSGKPLPDLLRTLDFKAKFEMFRDRVKVLPPLDCKKIAGAR